MENDLKTNLKLEIDIQQSHGCWNHKGIPISKYHSSVKIKEFPTDGESIGYSFLV